MPEKEGINRQVHFIMAPAFDSEDHTGINNTWQYRRAPEGYLFILDEIYVSVRDGNADKGQGALIDGHEYTHWNLWEGVQCNEYLARWYHDDYTHDLSINLHGWKCKEYTLAVRSSDATKVYKICAIIWYWLKKANREELLEFAIKHPSRQDTFKRAMRGTTVEPLEE